MDDRRQVAAQQARPVGSYTGRIGTRVALAREGCGISQEVLADTVGITADRLRLIESSAVDPSVSEIRHLSRALGGADYLLATRPIDACYADLAL